MSNDKQQFFSLIKELSTNYILSCKLSLYLLDLQRNYSNYMYNRDEEIENLDSGIYELKTRKSSIKYNQMENYIWLCYDYLDKKHNITGESNKEVFEIESKKIDEDLKKMIINIYNEEEMEKQNLETIMSATCLYMSCHSPDNEYNKELRRLTRKICETTENECVGKLRKKFKDKRNVFCSCFVKDNSKGLDCFAFSGGWDNNDYPNDLTKYLPTMREFIKAAAKTIFRIDLAWCVRSENMKSYELRWYNNKCSILNEIWSKYQEKRMNCINIHFSCCERKVLPYFEDKEKVDLEIYVTFNPCSDCELAIHQFLNEKENRKIKVFYSEEKILSPHKVNCDLYKA